MWLAPLTLQEVVQIASNFTVAQFLEHETFRKRIAESKPLYIHEFIYALMQAYDALNLKTDVQVGGTDQLFNIMAGRHLQRALGEQALIAVCTPLLIGTDAPQLEAAYLRAAAGALDGVDAVFGPAADGGYTLVGLKRPAPELFLQMRWSHDSVMSQTRQRLAQLQLRHAELPVLHDVDEPADLVHLPPHLMPTTTKA